MGCFIPSDWRSVIAAFAIWNNTSPRVTTKLWFLTINLLYLKESGISFTIEFNNNKNWWAFSCCKAALVEGSLKDSFNKPMTQMPSTVPTACTATPISSTPSSIHEKFPCLLDVAYDIVVYISGKSHMYTSHRSCKRFLINFIFLSVVHWGMEDSPFLSHQQQHHHC